MALQKYHCAARLLHWLLLLFICGNLCLGYYLTTLDYYHPLSQSVLSQHRLLGVICLVIASLFFGAHYVFRRPSLEASLAVWERIVARLVHSGLFLLILFVPLSGIILSQGGGKNIQLIECLTIPAFWVLDEQQQGWVETAHNISAYVLAALIGLHGSAAIKHHFLDKNNTLRKMLW